jgi:hypothetical protein
MNRTHCFLLGLVLGATGLAAAQNYWVIQAEDGLHVVRKLESRLELPYVDIRQFSLEDWKSRPELAKAIFRANQANATPAVEADAWPAPAGTLLERLQPRPANR